jgi:branched-chain amino acid transport system substrate-binding protein
VEDHGYQVSKAVQAINKLVNRDKIFAMLLGLGTPMNMASFKVLERKNIPNVYPLSSARQMVSEPQRLRFMGAASYYDAIRVAVGHMVENEGSSVVCSMYIPSDFGKEIQLAAMDEAAKRGLRYAAETTHKPDETNYVGALTKLRDAGCDLIAVALSVRGVITAVGTAKKIGWSDVKFLGSSAAFHTAIAKVPGDITEGLFAGAVWSDLEARAGDPEVAAWIKSYTAATGEKFPGTGALLGYGGARMLHEALQTAGRDLSVESFLKGMESLDYEDKIMGNVVKTSPENHIGATRIFISQVKNGKWVLVGSAN